MQEKNTEKNTTDSINITYDCYGSISEIEDFGEKMIVKAITSPPSWWRNISPFAHGIKSVEDIVENIDADLANAIDNGRILTTSKRCPGIINHLRQSLVIKTPHDILIRTGINPDEVQWTTPVDCIQVSTHSSSQTGEAPFHTIKFIVPIVFKTDKPTNVTMIDPVFYNDLGYRISPGISPVDSTQVFFLNLITLFPRIEKSYHIKKNSILALLQFGSALNKIQREDLSQDRLKLQFELQSTIATNNGVKEYSI